MKIKKMIAFLVVLIMSCVLFNIPAIADAAQKVDQSPQQKNETVYAALNNDGSVDQIIVVNQLIGAYSDYGDYIDVKNLSTQSMPVIDGDHITFPDQHVTGGLFYQGTMQGELPMTFDITYYLDGQPVEAGALAGADGHLKIDIDCCVNEKCAADIRDGLMAQISVTLDQNTAGNIDAGSASVVVAGTAVSINYMILPGESGIMSLEADIHDFEMDAITITLLKGSVAGIGDTIGDIEQGFEDMIGGAEDMVDGSYELKDGMISLRGGISSLNSGMSKLASSGEEIENGMVMYKDGLSQYVTSIQSLAPASNEIKSGLDALASNGAVVAGGVSEISAGLGAVSASGAELRVLAESLLASADPSVQALAQGMIQTLDGVDQISSGLSAASAGVGEYTAAVQQAASGYEAFDTGITSVSSGGADIVQGYADMTDGYSAYLDGIKSSANGVYRLKKSVNSLPDDIQKLIDGQIEFRDGISDAKTEITEQTDPYMTDDMTAVSFTSLKNSPNSVQYILTTPRIAVEKHNEQTQTEEKNEDFFTRLIDLFQ